MKEKLWNANYIKVMTTNFLLYFAFYLLTPLLPLYLSENFGATSYRPRPGAVYLLRGHVRCA